MFQILVEISILLLAAIPIKSSFYKSFLINLIQDSISIGFIACCIDIDVEDIGDSC